jgi:tetratricopeptide (TPR) repeat protein
VALENYLEQSVQLRDVGVSAHTTRLAQFLQRENEALISAQQWVELDPENAEANNTLAELLARQGRTPEALPHLVVVERQTGAANFPILLNGFRDLSEEQRTELIQNTSTLSAEFPESTRLLLTQALLHADAGQFDRALDEIDALLELEPGQPQAILLEARILVSQKANNPYARLQQALKDKPDDKLLRLQYARLLTATDMPAARQQFEILSEQSPRDGDLLFSLALINREIANPVAARELLHQTIALGQRVDESYYFLGRIAEEESEPEEALSNYMQVGIGPEYLPANSRIGQILIESGQLDRYHAWFNDQRNGNPQLHDEIYSLEADILIQAGAQRQAMQVFNQALVEEPNSIPLRYGRAMLSEQLDDLSAMEKDLRTIIATDPDNATALNALGYTLADRTERYDEALDLISRALALEPAEPAILDSMGWVLFRTGQYESAVEYLTRAYANFPDSEVAAHLGEVLWVQGKTEAAMNIWRGALLRDPGDPKILATLGRLGIDPPVDLPAKDPVVEDQP